MESNNIWICKECIQEQNDITIANTKKSMESRQIIEESRKRDSSIIDSTEIFNAQTTPASELMASIQSNPEIPEDEKYYAFVKEIRVRIEALQPIIFQAEKFAKEKKNEKAMWQIQLQEFAPRIKNKEQRKEFDKDIINYPSGEPRVKSIKGAVTTNKPGHSVQRKELNEMASKHGINPSALKMRMEAYGVSAETAALEIVAKRNKSN
jgi:homoserine dehydrogenase